MQSTRVNTIVRISGTICIYFTFLSFFFPFLFSLSASSARGNEYSEDRCRSIYRGGGGGLFDEIRSNRNSGIFCNNFPPSRIFSFSSNGGN